jgi:hypothetical protein
MQDRDHIVLVTGGRSYGEGLLDRAREERSHVFRVLDTYHAKHPITVLVHGACSDPRDKRKLRGADHWAEQWAKLNEITYIGVPAKWTKHGKPAGMIRNRQMIDKWKPHACIPLPGGTGTAGCVAECRRRGIEVMEVDRG